MIICNNVVTFEKIVYICSYKIVAMGSKYLQDSNGNFSNSRLVADIVIVIALIFAQEVLYFGRDNVITAAAAAGTIFITVAGPALAFLFAQKKNELKQQKNE